MSKNNSIVYKRIYYGSRSEQFGDLRYKQGEGLLPVVIIIHGGFWKNHVHLDIMNEFAEFLTDKGFATWNIEYRRVGDEGGGWPGTFLDCEQATDYIKTLSNTHPLDANKVIIIGHSAGGQLALWLAARKNILSNSEISKATDPLLVNGVISLAGVLNLEMMYEVHHLKDKMMKTNFNPVEDLLEGTPENNLNRYEESSPNHLLPIGVPIVLLHGSLDINVPIGISQSFEKEALSFKEDVYLEEIPDAEHFKVIFPDENIKRILMRHIKNILKETNV